MEQTILKPWQKKVITLVDGEQKMAGFYLTGGTALAAYYLRHRLSDDLDFFCFEEADNIFLHAFAELIKIDNIFLGGEFAKVKRVEALPQMISPITKEELKKFFQDLAKKLSPEIFE